MIRKFENTDITKCAKLMQAVYNNEMWQNHWSDITATAYLREIADNKRFIGFTLIENDEVIGALMGREKTWWTNDELFIEEMLVLPKFQRLGFGTQLLMVAEAYISEMKLAGFTLLTNRFAFAPDFYRKNGFTDAEHVQFMYKNI